MCYYLPIKQATSMKFNKLYKNAVTRLENEKKNMEATHIAKSIKQDNSIECKSKTSAFITLRDHKENVRSSYSCRLINP